MAWEPWSADSSSELCGHLPEGCSSCPRHRSTPDVAAAHLGAQSRPARPQPPRRAAQGSKGQSNRGAKGPRGAEAVWREQTAPTDAGIPLSQAIWPEHASRQVRGRGTRVGVPRSQAPLCMSLRAPFERHGHEAGGAAPKVWASVRAPAATGPRSRGCSSHMRPPPGTSRLRAPPAPSLIKSKAASRPFEQKSKARPAHSRSARRRGHSDLSITPPGPGSVHSRCSVSARGY